MEGQAYIVFEVRPPYSETIALELSKQPEVLYAAAIWGTWDVIARVATTSAVALVKFVNNIQTSFKDVIRTETYFIRSDQYLESETPPTGTKWSFLFLKVDANSISLVLNNLRALTSKPKEFAQMLHVAGTLGSYDLVLTVKYFNDIQLKKLVIDDIQRKNGIVETVTIPSIEQAVFQKGKVVG